MKSEERREYCRQWRLKKLAEDPEYERRKKKATYKPKKEKREPDAWTIVQREYQKKWREAHPTYHKEWRLKNYD